MGPIITAISTNGAVTLGRGPIIIAISTNSAVTLGRGPNSAVTLGYLSGQRNVFAVRCYVNRSLIARYFLICIH